MRDTCCLSDKVVWRILIFTSSNEFKPRSGFSKTSSSYKSFLSSGQLQNKLWSTRWKLWWFNDNSSIWKWIKVVFWHGITDSEMTQWYLSNGSFFPMHVDHVLKASCWSWVKFKYWTKEWTQVQIVDCRQQIARLRQFNDYVFSFANFLNFWRFECLLTENSICTNVCPFPRLKKDVW